MNIFQSDTSVSRLLLLKFIVLNNRVVFAVLPPSYRCMFIHRHAEEYTAVFVFQGILGEEQQRLEVRGQGSYDGLFESQVNV